MGADLIESPTLKIDCRWRDYLVDRWAAQSCAVFVSDETGMSAQIYRVRRDAAVIADMSTGPG